MDRYTTAINVRLPEKLYKELKDRAEENNIQFSAMIRIALSDYISQTKK